MGDVTQSRKRKISRSALNPPRYGRCRAKQLMGNEGWFGIDVLANRIYDLKARDATKGLIVDIHYCDITSIVIIARVYVILFLGNSPSYFFIANRAEFGTQSYGPTYPARMYYEVDTEEERQNCETSVYLIF